MKQQHPRSGYAMVLVLLFLILMFSLMTLAYGRLGAALRAESVRAKKVQRDEGSTQALAQALALLETGLPPSNPYSCTTNISTSLGASPFTVTFALQSDKIWKVESTPTAPGEILPAMPATFAQ
jgi:hypothetical protein